ncbi:MAG: signal peptidase I [Eubacteriales bacterium]|nr:signal peptidase I [Eubacteriales bacterium]
MRRMDNRLKKIQRQQTDGKRRKHQLEEAPHKHQLSDRDIPLELLEAELRWEKRRAAYRRTVRNTVFILVTVAAVAVLLAMLLIPVLRINGTSMTDTLQDKDIVVAVNGSSYEQGEVIAFYYNNNILIKRVIAAQGDWVDIDADGNVFVNGIQLDEPYVSDKALGKCNITLPYQVPEGQIFVMGDHRETSLDSRNTAVGCIDDELVIGKILFCIWPLSDIGMIK